MKKTLYIFLTLSILTIGCNQKDDDSVQPVTNLDSNLFGIWTCSDWDFPGSGKTWTYHFLSDGTYNEICTSPSGNCNSTNFGTWLTQNQSLYQTSEDEGGNIPYIIQGDSLTLDFSVVNGPGEIYLFIKQ